VPVKPRVIASHHSKLLNKQSIKGRKSPFQLVTYNFDRLSEVSLCIFGAILHSILQRAFACNLHRVPKVPPC